MKKIILYILSAVLIISVFSVLGTRDEVYAFTEITDVKTE